MVPDSRRESNPIAAAVEHIAIFAEMPWKTVSFMSASREASTRQQSGRTRSFIDLLLKGKSGCAACAQCRHVSSNEFPGWTVDRLFFNMGQSVDRGSHGSMPKLSLCRSHHYSNNCNVGSCVPNSMFATIYKFYVVLQFYYVLLLLTQSIKLSCGKKGVSQGTCQATKTPECRGPRPP